MFREMRRKMQELPAEECEFILKIATSGVLALDGDDGYPYALPISHMYDGEKIYFHCANEGHKIDAIKRNEKASFCVVFSDDVVPERYTTHYRSVIVFGKIRVIEDENEKRKAVTKLALKFAPNDDEKNREHYIEKDFDRLTMLEMEIEHLTGKEARELMVRRAKNE